MTRHIYQKGTTDCGIAAMAMFAGISYQEALDEVLGIHPDHVPGEAVTLQVMLATLHRLVELPVMGHVSTVRRPAIICVLSPADLTMGHAVYWDGEKVYDPSPTAPFVDEAWFDHHCFAQIQKVADLIEGAPSRRRVALLDLMATDGQMLSPGQRVAA